MEVCVDSVRSAINAVEGGASRLEVCSALVSEGGLTPTLGLFKAVKEIAGKVDVPVFAMIRLRGGDDFCYSQEELKVMEEDARILKKAGVDGFVFGALTKDGDVDTRTCAALLKIAGHLPTTFHRAFDMIAENQLKKSLETLVNLGFRRILTNGGTGGPERVGALVEAAHGRIGVMPGGGIGLHNLARVLETTLAIEFHGSAKTDVKSPSEIVESWVSVTDKKIVKDMVAIYQRYMASKH